MGAFRGREEALTQMIRLRLGDSFELLSKMDDDSVGTVCTDPPYGLEFMGKGWDKLWETGAGMTKVGLGDRDIPWPSHGTNLPHGGMNPTCAVCGGRLRGAKKCSCDQPHDHWKPVGKRRGKQKDEDDRLKGYIADIDFKGFVLPRQRKRNIKCPDCGKYVYDHPGRACVCGGVQRLQQHRMQEWHYRWLIEVFRVLKPGGIIKVFGATRTFHRMAAAMEDAGFTNLDLEAWMYGSGFPKSLNVSKALDKKAGAEREKVRVPAERVRNPKSINSGHGIEGGDRPWMQEAEEKGFHEMDGEEPVSEEAQRYEGFGTALKPAWEPFVVGRKPL